MPAQAGIQFPGPRLLDSRFRGNDTRIQVLAVYLRNGRLVEHGGNLSTVVRVVSYVYTVRSPAPNWRSTGAQH
jgi:hypothetical protein